MCPLNVDAVSWHEGATDREVWGSMRPPDAAPPVILIVDDDPIVRALMHGAFEDDGFSVIEAEDGAQACRRCDDMVPSLLVVDAVMPNMDGFELCRQLRQRAATRHVPILMATGLDDHDSIAKAYEAGATDFIAKPINWQILHHRIRYILRGAKPWRNCVKTRNGCGPPKRWSGNTASSSRRRWPTCRKGFACSVRTAGLS